MKLLLLLPLEDPLVLFEAPLAWPLPLAAGSGSHEGHMLVDVGGWKATSGGEKKLEVR